MAHAAESLHWYTRTGQTAYEVRAANGSMRPTTLRDARKLLLVPSVTAIIKCADRPGLTNWMIDQAILSALTLPRKPGEPEAEWLKRVKQDSKEQARQAAVKGNLIHAAIQGHYEGEPPLEGFWPHVKGATRAVDEWMGEQHWTPERSFAHQMGFGGKVDLSCAIAACDFKSKEFGPDADLTTYDEHHMQLAAYLEGLGIGVDKGRGAIVYVSASHPGLARLIEIKREDLQKGWQMFYSLLSFWQAKTGYASSWIPGEKVAA